MDNKIINNIEYLCLEFEVYNKVVCIEIISVNETQNILKEKNAHLNSVWSKEYASNIYQLSDGKILIIQNTGYIYGIMAKSIDDFHLVRTQSTICKFSQSDQSFYFTNYYKRDDIDTIINKYHGKELTEYSNINSKLMLLNNGKYFFWKSFMLRNRKWWEGYLYNSLDEANKIKLFERIKDSLEQ